MLVSAIVVVSFSSLFCVESQITGVTGKLSRHAGSVFQHICSLIIDKTHIS